MRSPKTFILKKSGQHGFTLIEVLLVIGIATILFGMSIAMGLNTYTGYNFRNERDTAISALQKARSQAISNICLGGDSCANGLPHGVHFETGKYVVFQGTIYDAGSALNETIITSGNINIAVTPDIIFTQLSGEADPAPWTLNLQDQSGHSSDITINNSGRIAWTN